MYRRLDDFLKKYEEFTKSSSRLLAMVTDENMGQQVAPDHRNLGQIAWHVVTSVAEMTGRTGLKLSAVDHEAPPPACAADITDAYRRVTEELVEALKANWTDETLEVEDDMYGMQWPRGLTLSILLDHETHHRGQMTVLLRQANQQVPGMCGPSKEEWTQYGLKPPAY